ncbi:TIGR02922 family protein [Parashewanella tropica]|uniref:TIGR02922 family protein n=1 Tax=Parashewanella tropica TaxID=2547970 RepID=UPI00105A8B1E|nr:TIGR02922 family protein [Parashewanella tropica]
MDLNNNFPKTKTVTVLYFEAPAGAVLYSSVLHELPYSENSRIVLPNTFRKGKNIIAVMEGNCRLLNGMGERISVVEAVNE